MWDYKDIEIALKGMEYEIVYKKEFENFISQDSYKVYVDVISWGDDGIYINFILSVITPNPRLAYIKIMHHCLDYDKVEKLKFTDFSKNPCVNAGNNIIAKENSVIGGDGFGYEWDKKKHLKFLSIGGVIIGDNVDIGSNTCIDRGTLGDTIIGNDVKIDNLCHIAHNVIIEDNVIIIAGCIIGGSAVIKKDAFIGMGAKIKNGITIGEKATIGMGAVVLKDVPAGETWVGNPAKKLKQ